MMQNQRNLRIYRYWAPLYDAWIPLLSGRARQHAIGVLNPQPGERLLIPGIGTGLDLPHLPHGISITGVDYSPDMLARIQAKNRTANLAQMDAQQLGFPAGSFDAVLFNLILSVVPNGIMAFREGWRVLRPGGCVLLCDIGPPSERWMWMTQLLVLLFHWGGAHPEDNLEWRIPTMLEDAGFVAAGTVAHLDLLAGMFRIHFVRAGVPVRSSKVLKERREGREAGNANSNHWRQHS